MTAATGNVQVNVQTLNDGTTAVSATGNDTATTTFTECAEAILVLQCTAIGSSGVFTPVLAGSVDGGTTYSALTPTTGSAMSNVSATGAQTYRFKNLPPKVRTQWTKVSGTSVTVAAILVGIIPQDSVNASAI